MTPVLFRVTKLVLSVILAQGVKVVVHVMPPSLELTEVRIPLAVVRSTFVKPATASLKVIVTSDVSPIVRLLSATTMLAVGRVVSIA